MSVLQICMLQELAQELSGAGFPNIQDVQHRQGREFLTPDGRVSVYSLGEEACAEDWFLPTLSELIAACGGKFFSLILDCGKWRCAASGLKDMMIYIQLPLKPSPACGWPCIRRYDDSRASIPCDDVGRLPLAPVSYTHL